MSLQQFAMAVGCLVGIMTIFKMALDINANPEHKSAALKLLNAARRLVPFSMVVVGYFIGSSGLVCIALVLENLNFSISTEPHATRIETAAFVIFVFTCFGAVQLISMDKLANAMTKAANTSSQSQEVAKPPAD